MASESFLHQGLSKSARNLADSGDNYRVFQHPEKSNAFAVIGAGADPDPYVRKKFAESGTSQVANELTTGRANSTKKLKSLVLYVHGFSNSSSTVAEKAFNYPNRIELKEDEVWVSYDWHGEQALSPFAIYSAFKTAVEFAVNAFIFFALVWIALIIALATKSDFFTLKSDWRALLLCPSWIRWLSVGVAITLCSLTVTILIFRASSYFRDLYVESHRGVPDLCEFLRYLDSKIGAKPGEKESEDRVELNIIGHSMGCLLTLNAIRVLSDLFSVDSSNDPGCEIGKRFTVGALILVAPDAPVELLKMTQNNYFYPAIRRFQRMVVLSNANDGVLHALGYSANSFAEPQPAEGRYRLGNVFFPKGCDNPASKDLLERIRFQEIKVFDPKRDPSFELERRQALLDLINRKIAFIDCSKLPEVTSIWIRMWCRIPPLADFFALLSYVARSFHVKFMPDCHSGYFDCDRVWCIIRQALNGVMPNSRIL